MIPSDPPHTVQPGTQTSELCNAALRRRRGPPSKITRLPQHLRDRITQMLDDQKPYSEICAEMATHGFKLNPTNISKYYSQQYQDRVTAIERTQALRNLHEDVRAFTPDDPLKLQESMLQISLIEIFRGLKTANMATNPVGALRLLNAVARLNREALTLRKASDALDAITDPQVRKNPLLADGSVP